MSELLELNINGEKVELNIKPYESLFETLKNKAELPGVKRGCDTGGCGCCTMLVDGQSRYSCMTYTLSVKDQAITTVEGLAKDGQLDPLQQGFMNAGAVQCGYCTCGMIMSAKNLLDKNASPTEKEIRQGIAGNLCRCTGYAKIVEAIGLAADSSK